VIVKVSLEWNVVVGLKDPSEWPCACEGVRGHSQCPSAERPSLFCSPSRSLAGATSQGTRKRDEIASDRGVGPRGHAQPARLDALA
jgi:hypothetical protein